MNLHPELPGQSIGILHAVRKGYALATAEQLELLRACLDVEVLAGGWVPRWALEASSALERAGCAPEAIRQIFARGRAAVQDELLALVRSGHLAHAVEPRRPYERLTIDLPTELALAAAIDEHKNRCGVCRQGKRCWNAIELEDELEMLFPHERRARSRL